MAAKKKPQEPPVRIISRTNEKTGAPEPFLPSDVRDSGPGTPEAPISVRPSEEWSKRMQAEDRPVESVNSPIDYAQMAWGAPALARAVAKYGAKALGRGVAQVAAKDAAIPVSDTMLLKAPTNKWAPGKVLTPNNEPFVNVAAMSPEEAAWRMGPEGKTLKDIRFASPEDWKALAQKKLAERTNPGIRPAVDLRSAQTGAGPVPPAAPAPAPRTHVDDVVDWLKGLAGLPKGAASTAMNSSSGLSAPQAQWGMPTKVLPADREVQKQIDEPRPDFVVDLTKEEK